MKIYNSLSRQVELVELIDPYRVGMYTCGPTVYSFITIGNWRTYVLGDLLTRTFTFLGYQVDYVMNITDVGHLTGDNLGDADLGEDRMEKASKKEGKTAWDVAEFYTQDFLLGFEKMNLMPPKVFCMVTDHIDEQIELVKKLEGNNLAYRLKDGVYFDVREYETQGGEYGVLSTLDKIKEGARVEKNEKKRDPRDFALWKFSKEGEKRQMEWESPWGVGFPGWHIECSAISMKYLGTQFDLHVGGEDLRSTHHPNEIAQSEGATGKKPFARYWVHGAFLKVDGGRMGKSLGNAFTIADIEEKGFSPMDLRYFYMTGHYRKQLNFTWEGLESAREARQNLEAALQRMGNEVADELSDRGREFAIDFEKKLSIDLSMPEVLAVVWGVVKSGLDNGEKLKLILKFDEVLGLELNNAFDESVPEAVSSLVQRRNKLRAEKKFDEADKVREKIESMGYVVEDVGGEARVVKK